MLALGGTKAGVAGLSDAGPLLPIAKVYSGYRQRHRSPKKVLLRVQGLNLDSGEEKLSVFRPAHSIDNFATCNGGLLGATTARPTCAN